MNRSMCPRWIQRAALASMLSALGCVSNTIELEDEGSGTESDEGNGTQTGTTTTGTTLNTSAPPPPTTTPPPDPDPDTTDDGVSESDTAGGPGFCNLTCESSTDCGPGADFACIDGFCEFVGEALPCNPAECDELGIGVCGEVDGISQCTFPCTVGGPECTSLGLECIGEDDAGNAICVSEPCFGAGEGEPCDIDGVGSFGTCVDGLCACSSDEECTFEGFACDV